MNGTKAWLFGICAVLVTAAVTGSFKLQWTMSQDVSAIAASMQATIHRVDRLDTRLHGFDGRLRAVERVVP